MVRRGGGQADSWHDLNARGRYAGQIRIELTFYDSRPKEDEQPDLIQDRSSLDVGDEDQFQGRISGPREPGAVKRRPLPTPNTKSPPESQTYLAESVVPIPQTAPRSYHTPPRQDVAHHEAQQASYNAFNPSNNSNYDHSSSSNYYTSQVRPLPTASHYSTPPRPHHDEYRNDQVEPDTSHRQLYYQEPDNYDDGTSGMVYADDPYALQAIEAAQARQNSYDSFSQSLPRHNRVQQLAGDAPQRPHASGGISHAYSAPLLGPQERAHHSPPDTVHGASHVQHELYVQSKGPPPPSHSSSDSHIHTRSGPALTPHAVTRQPQPPTHRHSMPPQEEMSPVAEPQRAVGPDGRTLRFPPRHPSYPPQPEPVSWLRNEPFSQHEHDYYDYQTPQYPDRRHSGDAVMTTGYNENSYPMSQDYSRPAASLQPRRMANQEGLNPRRAHPMSEIDYNAIGYNTPGDVPKQSRLEGPPIVRPRPISPNAPPGSQTPRKAVSTQAVPQTKPNDMFSPDSFAAYNPNLERSSPASHASASASNGLNPMYTSQKSQSGSPAEPKNDPVRRDSDHSFNPDGSITRTDGKVVDPSDHLPSNTYAPEPERKGADRNRSSVNVNVKARFGPREHRLPPASAPAPAPLPVSQQPAMPPKAPYPVSQSQPIVPTLQHRQTAPPSTFSDAMSNSFPATPPAAQGRNRLQKRAPASSSPGAPPVPGKIPLDAAPHTTGPYPPIQMQTGRGMVPAPSAVKALPHAGPMPPSSGSSALSQEMSRIDLGPSPAGKLATASEARYGGSGGGAGRLRRSRFGA